MVERITVYVVNNQPGKNVEISENNNGVFSYNCCHRFAGDGAGVRSTGTVVKRNEFSRTFGPLGYIYANGALRTHQLYFYSGCVSAIISSDLVILSRVTPWRIDFISDYSYDCTFRSRTSGVFR